MNVFGSARNSTIYGFVKHRRPRFAARSYVASGLNAAFCRALVLTVLSCTILMQAGPAFAKPRYAAFVIDRNSGKTLFARNADAPRFPASLTKMMTLYVVFDLIESGRISYKTKLRVTKNAASQQPSKLGLKAGTKISVRTAIRALVTKSANDVAVTVAENLAGTEAKFARIMTWKARQIGMKKSTFKNASGLPHVSQLTTARDMAILGERLMTDFPKQYKFFKTRNFAYKGRSYRNHNALLSNYSGTDGIKTGYTRASGFNLVASVRRGKKHLIGVVLGGKTSRRRNTAMRSMLTRAFKKASTVKRRVAKKARKRIRIPTPMIANLQPDRETPQLRGRYRTSATRAPLRAKSRTRTAALRAPVPQPVLRRPNRTASRNQAPVHINPVRNAPTRRNVRSAGGFHIQIGAYDTRREAELKIMEVSHRLGGKLNGHRALTMPFNLKNRKLFYRARFAGFDRARASTMCNRIKAARFDCLVMRAE